MRYSRVRTRAGFIQVLLACGCVAALLFGAVVAAGAYFLFFRGNSSSGAPALTDTGQVRGLAEQILPGAELREGQVGFLGQSTGNYIMAFAGPAGLAKDGLLGPGQLLIGMVAFPAGQATWAQAENDLRSCLESQGYKLGKNFKVVDDTEAPVKVGIDQIAGKAHRRILQVDKSTRLVQYSLLLENEAGRSVVLTFEGNEAGFPAGFPEAYLKTARVRPLGSPLRFGQAEPAQTPQTEASPGSEETPVVEESPEFDSTPAATEPVPAEETPATPAPKPTKSPGAKHKGR